MGEFGNLEIEEALRPIASLIGKSEKARQKLAQGTWQHTMLCENLKALYIASALMKEGVSGTPDFTAQDLLEALRSLGSMINRSESAQAKFMPGTSQYTLQRNRLGALRMASALVSDALASRANQ